MLDGELLRDLALDADQIVAAAGLVGRSASLHELAYDLLAENERIMAATFDAAIDAYLDAHLERIVVLSSTMVYESATEFPTPEGAQLTSPPPASTYGLQKLASEYFALGAWEQYRLPYTILRPSSPVGIAERGGLAWATATDSQGDRLATNHVVADLVAKILADPAPLHIHGDGAQVRSFIAARDLARGIRMAMESPDAVNEDFNLCHGEGISILELARRIWTRLRPDQEFRYVSDAPYPYDVPNRVPDGNKAREVLGFEATTPLEAMLDEVIAWVRDELAAGSPAAQRD